MTASRQMSGRIKVTHIEVNCENTDECIAIQIHVYHHDSANHVFEAARRINKRMRISVSLELSNRATKLSIS